MGEPNQLDTAALPRSPGSRGHPRTSGTRSGTTRGVTVPDDQIDDTRVTVMQWARKASPHIAACIEDDLRRAAAHRAAGIKDLLDTVIDALWQEQATPAQDTGPTPEQIHHAVAMRHALADVVTGSTGRTQLADRIERVAASLVASLREQDHNAMDGVA